ncbi:hypothetical protein BRADI_4g09863v3 [Brachypodium distachyon]|uniref:Uncharacterized protein n=1 Tax=Brachypodium distachyon TaxID=15368 RepID=A0A0Q3L3P5_BRADI|nr:hypothetical protein BRADI_4g09863v3 [Brachypodium distachyon]
MEIWDEEELIRKLQEFLKNKRYVASLVQPNIFIDILMVTLVAKSADEARGSDSHI